jgi:hypothetical protein|tara:strand:- start:171 stop:581 length:411 start_codon:yes stop_codon:yes gene_type:complete
MARKKQGSFKMKGHTLPGINQKSETVNLKDGRSPSSAFQMKEAGDSPLPMPNWMKKAGRVGLGVATGGMSEVIGAGIKGAKNLFGGGGGNEDAEAGKKLLKEEAKEEMEGAMPMKLGPKNKLGGELNEGVSPHQNI